MEEFQFPQDFMMGSSAASVLNEGGNRNTNWFPWSQNGYIVDGSNVLRGTDHWNRYEEDIQIMKQLNHDTYCMSIEWSRVEPESPGVYDREAINHYRKELLLLQQNGIQPMLALHHFSNPVWFDKMGGWEKPEAVELFTAYSRFVVSQLGDLVCDWITINDANILLACSYLWGLWPPGKTDCNALFKAMRHMGLAHLHCYREIHQIRAAHTFPGKTNVGIALHFRIFEPKDNKLLSRLSTKFIKYWMNDLILSAMTFGKFRFPLGWGGYPAGQGKFFDFIGVNYWTRNLVRFTFDPKELFCELEVKKDVETNEVGWEIYPEGIYRVCKELFAKYQTPIFITQNGLREPVDHQRARVIYQNLKYVASLIDEGIPVKRFYVWTLVDMFECHGGEKARLGLVHNDFETQSRTIRKSGWFYGEVCAQKGVTAAMVNKYL